MHGNIPNIEEFNKFGFKESHQEMNVCPGNCNISVGALNVSKIQNVKISKCNAEETHSNFWKYLRAMSRSKVITAT
jgi:hypothetical protein